MKYEVKIRIRDGDDTFYTQMMCIPREGNTLNLHTHEGEEYDLEVLDVHYARVGKYEDGSHSIEIITKTL